MRKPPTDDSFDCGICRWAIDIGYIDVSINFHGADGYGHADTLPVCLYCAREIAETLTDYEEDTA